MVVHSAIIASQTFSAANPGGRYQWNVPTRHLHIYSVGFQFQQLQAILIALLYSSFRVRLWLLTCISPLIDHPTNALGEMERLLLLNLVSSPYQCSFSDCYSVPYKKGKMIHVHSETEKQITKAWAWLTKLNLIFMTIQHRVLCWDTGFCLLDWVMSE
jgi:hypothetical protein